MAQFFRSDVHEHVFAVWIITIEALNRVLHRAASSPFAPPNCSSSILPNWGSGLPTFTVYISFLVVVHFVFLLLFRCFVPLVSGSNGPAIID